MSNFQFISSQWPSIYSEAKEAENLCLVSPKASVIISRSALEKTVQWLFANDADLQQPYDTSLNAMMHERSFQDILKPSMFREINLIRKIGNTAAHGGSIKQEESLVVIKNLFRFLSFLSIYYAEDEVQIPTFNETIIPTGEEQKIQQAQLELLQAKLAQQNDAAQKEQKALLEKALEIEHLKLELEAQRAEVKARKEERKEGHNIDVEIPPLVSEHQTRKIYIDQNLKEAGWNKLREGYELEYEVKGMPISTNPSGKGYADYVLWGNNGKPLAVIEAKKTLENVRKGKHQASLYADCLEQMHGQRPIIFYTNGYETEVWDDTFYPARAIHGFLKKDELQLMIDRRKDRLDLRSFKVNEAIAGRKYQMEAIRRLAEHFSRTDNNGQLTGGSRKALLVMATGSGKTRTSAAIVDMLTRCKWAKRILFLADRNALVSQAKGAFNEYLPQLSSIDLTKEKEEAGTRIVFSTYPTILNKIDSVKSSDARFYGPGHFDLIIIDEAHRSVYQKYRAIFEYFDALLIGLTATPKTEIDRNTYSLFEIEDDNPTMAYELDQAVRDKFLVPPKGIEVPIKFLREGIKYADLSEEEKAEYEEKFGDPTTGEIPDAIDSTALNQWLFNISTVNTVLKHVMDSGIKVEGGDKLGKTIIFAKNHDHAVFIEEQFNKLYPELKGHFLRVIDNYETKAQDLLEKFVDNNQEVNPQIAVSVDMMDTGVDAPRVVNLVFFKRVQSLSKFWQMIGRGTRLRPDLFGPNQDKSEFLVFDYCENFTFFDVNPKGIEGSAARPLNQQIFDAQLEVIHLIENLENTDDSYLELAEIYRKKLHGLVFDLKEERFEVKMRLRAVQKYKMEANWHPITLGTLVEIKENVSSLVPPQPGDHELARRFDLMVLRLILTMLTGREGSRYRINIAKAGRKLSGKLNIPAVATQSELINEIQTEAFWNNITERKLESVRVALRDLMKFLDQKDKVIVYTNLEDEIDLSQVQEREVVSISMQMQPYKDRVESYIRKNRHHITIDKLRNDLPITGDELQVLENMLFDGDERGSKEDYIKEFGEQPLGKFIRSIVGLDIEAANKAFAQFLSTGNLAADQISFINTIVMYLEKNGTIDPEMLFESPFTDLNDQGLIGVFDDAQSNTVVSILSEINERANVG